MRKVLISVVALSFFAVMRADVASAQGRITVYVTQAGEESGFTARGADDSVLDLTKSLSKKKRLAVVNSKAEADIIIRVDSRDSSLKTAGVNTYKTKDGKTHAYTYSQQERVVHATLEVDDYKLELHGEGAFWSQASDEVAKDIDKWVNDNLIRLVEKRKEKGGL
jgi:YD repeat-containing protein